MFLLMISCNLPLILKVGKELSFREKNLLDFLISFFAFLQSVLIYVYRLSSQSVIFYESYIAVNPEWTGLFWSVVTWEIAPLEVKWKNCTAIVLIVNFIMQRNSQRLLTFAISIVSLHCKVRKHRRDLLPVKLHASASKVMHRVSLACFQCNFARTRKAQFIRLQVTEALFHNL